ncbi:SDR family NAD(P)-dependent oxidoreductase [Rouxiella silvae]
MSSRVDINYLCVEHACHQLMTSVGIAMNEKKMMGKVVVVTGGSSGIGLAASSLFIKEGATVVIAARSSEGLRKAKEKLGENAKTFPVDVAEPEEICALMEHVGTTFGHIDVLFANAGISECPDILQTNETFFDDLMNTNVKGVFYAFTYALPWMSVGASAVFTSSVIQQRGKPGDALYAASKAAVRSFARTFAVDSHVIQKKVRVNVVSPGAIKTPLTVQATDNPEISVWVSDQVPLGRWGEADEVARAVLFLASTDASYLTGSEIAVDGGLGQV